METTVTHMATLKLCVRLSTVSFEQPACRQQVEGFTSTGLHGPGGCSAGALCLPFSGLCTPQGSAWTSSLHLNDVSAGRHMHSEFSMQPLQLFPEAIVGSHCAAGQGHSETLRFCEAFIANDATVCQYCSNRG